MERDDLIEYSLHGHHDESKGKEIRSKIYKVTILLTLITVIEVFIGASIKQSSDWWTTVKIIFILLTLLKAGYIVMIFMHLGDERKYLRNVILIPYFIFALYLVFIGLYEGTSIGKVWETMWQ
jgi:caa(3)-type oxidase subunit IV